MWNETGAFLDFSIIPAFYQTGWFLAACVAAFLVSLWSVYLLRLKQLEQQFNTALEARVDERTRIARELHDTLLQSFNGLLLRFQSVSNLLPGRPEEAKQRIDSAIEQASNAITEGRDAVHELRSGGLVTIDLAQVMANFGKELLSSSTSEVSRSLVFGLRECRGSSIRSFATKFTGLRQRHCAMRSGMRRLGELKWKSGTTSNTCGSESGTMERASIGPLLTGTRSRPLGLAWHARTRQNCRR